MILCVTLNPCLDKTLVVPSWRPGDLIRGQAVGEVVGGKGNNVARALRKLGRESQPATFLGGYVGQRCQELLREADGFQPLILPSKAATRVILTVRTEDTAEQTAFFDPDPPITRQEADAFFDLIEKSLVGGRIQALTLSGSSPCETTSGLYSDLITLSKSHRVPVFLDTYGQALEAIWGFWPDVIQLNTREASAFLGLSPGAMLSDEDRLELLDEWARRGVTCGIITNGPEAVYLCGWGRLYRIWPPEIQAINPVGSGDSLLAGLVDSWLSGQEPEQAIRWAVACGVANAMTWDAGAIEPDQVRRIAAELKVEAVDRPALAPNPSVLVRKTLGRRR